MRSLIGKGLALVVLGMVLTGCSGAMPMSRHMGIRPDEPIPWKKADTTSPAMVCDEYQTYVEYSIQLREAYHSRASQNRFWLYGAGILGLGVMAASGGLAVASAATAGTLGLLSISGAFAASSFAVIDNAVLADVYTIAAGKINIALKISQEDLPATNRYSDPETCRIALNGLRGRMLVVVNELEESRTNNAKAALVRAIAEQKKLKELAEQLIAASQDPTRQVLTAEITAVKDASDPTKPLGVVTADKEIRLTVTHFELERVAISTLKVRLGSAAPNSLTKAERTTPTNNTEWFITFTAPAAKPGLVTEYDPVLLVGDDHRVVNKSGTKIKYPDAIITSIAPSPVPAAGETEVTIKVDKLSFEYVAEQEMFVRVGADTTDLVPVVAGSKTKDTVRFKAPKRTVDEYPVVLLLGKDKMPVKSDPANQAAKLKYTP